MKKEYEELAEKQWKLLNENPYTNIEWFVYDEDKNVIVNIMSIIDEGKEYSDLKELTNLLNIYKNNLQNRKTTMSRMRKDVRRLSKELSRLKLNINIKYNQLQEEFKL